MISVEGRNKITKIKMRACDNYYLILRSKVEIPAEESKRFSLVRLSE